jgi:nucleoside-diphosphate-sugar epimerase
MKVLVTGHEGYIGSALTQVLRAAGHEVVGLDVGLYRAATFGAPPAGAELRTHDVDLRDVVLPDLNTFDAVLHLAALSNDPLAELDLQVTHDVNRRASVRLAGMARAAGVPRFLFASTCSVYGSSSDQILTEGSPRSPLTPYAQSKALVEDCLVALADDGFSPTILRSATVYGVSPRLRLDVVLNDFVAQAVATGTIRLRNSGLAWRPLVHVQDVCQAFLAALEAPRDAVHSQVFNLGSTRENYQLIELAERVREALPRVRLEPAPGGAPDLRDYYVSCDAIQRRLPAFRPRWTVSRGIDELVRALRAADLREADLPRYGRLAELRRRMAEGELGADLRRTVGRVAPARGVTPFGTPIAETSASKAAFKASA